MELFLAKACILFGVAIVALLFVLGPTATEVAKAPPIGWNVFFTLGVGGPIGMFELR
jgi:hypothetical protein